MKDREILIRLDTKMDAVKATLEDHSKKLDMMSPRLASHSDSIKWMKIIGGAAFSTASGVLYFIFHKLP